MKPSSARANFVVVPILVGISGIQNVPGWLPPANSKTTRHPCLISPFREAPSGTFKSDSLLRGRVPEPLCGTPTQTHYTSWKSRVSAARRTAGEAFAVAFLVFGSGSLSARVSEGTHTLAVSIFLMASTCSSSKRPFCNACDLSASRVLLCIQPSRPWI